MTPFTDDQFSKFRTGYILRLVSLYKFCADYISQIQNKFGEKKLKHKKSEVRRHTQSQVFAYKIKIFTWFTVSFYYLTTKKKTMKNINFLPFIFIFRRFFLIFTRINFLDDHFSDISRGSNPRMESFVMCRAD